MKYLKKFNESTSDFENDVNYMMVDIEKVVLLIHQKK